MPTPRPTKTEFAEFRRRLETAPAISDPGAVATLADAAGDMARLETALRDAEKRTPGNAQIRYRLADILLRRLKLNDAERMYRELNKADSRAPAPYIALSDIARIRGDKDAARAFLTKGVEANKNSPEGIPALIRFAGQYAALKDRTNADAVLQLALKSAPDDARVSLLLADLRRDAGKPASARQIVESVVQRDPLNIEAKRRLAALLAANAGGETDIARAGTLLTQVFQSGQTTPMDMMTAGRLAERSGDWAEAAQAYLNAATGDPENTEIRFRLTQAYRRLGKTDYAQKNDALSTRLREEQEKRADITGKRVLAPLIAANHFAEAQFAQKTQDWRIAAIAYDMAAQLAPKNEKIRQSRAGFYETIKY